MVEPFEDWCFDETRAAGDYGLVKTTYGYHIMYYVSSTPIWETYAKSGWVNEKDECVHQETGGGSPHGGRLQRHQAGLPESGSLIKIA